MFLMAERDRLIIPTYSKKLNVKIGIKSTIFANVCKCLEIFESARKMYGRKLEFSIVTQHNETSAFLKGFPSSNNTFVLFGVQD